MASQASRRRETCAHEDCGSRRFNVGEDGYTYCDQGHQQSERGTRIAEDTGELMQLGRISRKKDSDAESTTSRTSTFSGAHAFEHYLLCIQLVLRKQTYWLVTAQCLPSELEALAKDLWALRLQKVQNRVGYESETDTEAPSSQVFSSQSESEATHASRSTRRSRLRREKEKVQEGSPGLLDTLAICFISLLFLRIPVTVADMHRWTNAGNLLYYRAAREVPLGMRERLPPRYQAQLEPQDLLKASSIHAEVLSCLKLLSTELGLSPPVINVPLLRYRWLQQLILPVEVYAASKRLAELLSLTFDFELNTKIGSSSLMDYPEARLMAVMIVATKLLFPLDDSARYTASETVLSAVQMDWAAWEAQHKRKVNAHAVHFGECFDFNEAACDLASNDKLDAYLDWFEDNIASEEMRERGPASKDADLRRAMFKMFPTSGFRGGSATERPTEDSQSHVGERRRTVQAKLRPRSVRDTHSPRYADDDEAQPIGSLYRRYREASELSGVVKALFERAAELAGLSVHGLVQVVFAVERKMQTLEERYRKGEQTC